MDKMSKIKNKKKVNKTGVLCSVCGKTVSSVSVLNRHLRNVHSTESTGVLNNRISRMKCPEKNCCETFTRDSQLRSHLYSDHGIEIVFEELYFDSEEEFEQWRHDMQNKTLSEYVQDTSTKNLRYGFKKKYLNCHRSYTYRSLRKGSGIRTMKSQGTQKIGKFCPSRIEVVIKDKGQKVSVYVRFWKTHCGHSCDLGHSRLDRYSRDEIARMLLAGLSFEDILNTIHSGNGAELKRMTIVDRKYLHNILRDYNIPCRFIRQQENAAPVCEQFSTNTINADINEDMDITFHLPSPNELKHCIMNTVEPLVFHGLLNSWEIIKWTLDDWSKELEGKLLDFRIGSKDCQKLPQWEHTCKIISCTFDEFIEKTNKMDNNWMYFDYKYMHKYFQANSSVLKGMSWGDMGFDDKAGEDSTIWIGSEGAHTSCHMDTYGCNVVVQVYGRKSWILFPPEYTSSLKPVRVPYEESSVYSEFNFHCGSTDMPNVKGACVVEMFPGDILVVPKHWWHYVENLTTAISINMWIPLPSDDESRLEESLVRYFVKSAVKDEPVDEQFFLLNPNEIDLPSESNSIQQINCCAINYNESLHEADEGNTENITAIDDLICNFSDIVSVVPTISVDELKEKLSNKCKCKHDSKGNKDGEQYLSTQNVINAFCHPEVISKVKEILMSQIRPNIK